MNELERHRISWFDWCLIIIIAVLTFILLYSLCQAETKYNPFTDKFETTSPDAVIKYNPFDNSFSYQQPGSRIEYNPFQDNFQYAPPAQRKGNATKAKSRRK